MTRGISRELKSYFGHWLESGIGIKIRGKPNEELEVA